MTHTKFNVSIPLLLQEYGYIGLLRRRWYVWH